MYFFTFIFRKRERRKHIIYLFCREREFLESESKKKTYFNFNSGSFWVVLKLLKTSPLISPIYWVGSGQPTW